MGLFLLIIVAVIVFYCVLTYNSLVSIKNNVAKAWANIDVLLKQRHDELHDQVRVADKSQEGEVVGWCHRLIRK